MNIETGLLIYFRPDQRAWYALLECNLKRYHAQSYSLCFWLSYCLSMWIHPPLSKLVTCDAINTLYKNNEAQIASTIMNNFTTTAA